MGQRGPARGPARHRRGHRHALGPPGRGDRGAALRRLPRVRRHRRGRRGARADARPGLPAGPRPHPSRSASRSTAGATSPSERLDDDTRAWLDEYGHTPDVPASRLPDGWDPDDQLVRLLDERGRRAARPCSTSTSRCPGLRPTPETVAAINAEIGVMFEAVISIVERELYGEQVRMVTQARRAIESVRPGLGVEELLAELSEAMVEAMDVDTVDVICRAAPVSPSSRPTAASVADTDASPVAPARAPRGRADSRRGACRRSPSRPRRRCTRLHGHATGSARGCWCRSAPATTTSARWRSGRALDAPRWIASEIIAASVVASDMARLLLEARLMERERALNAELRDTQRLPPRHGHDARPRAAQPGERAVDAPGAAVARARRRRARRVGARRWTVPPAGSRT